MFGLMKDWLKRRIRKSAFWTPLTPFDHAFANGPVFQRPSSYPDALRIVQGDAHAARMLQHVFAQFDQKAILADGVRLGLNARLINLNARETVTIGRDSVIRGIIRNDSAGQIHIGDHVYVGDQSLLSSMSSIEIGDGTLLAHSVQLFDNDSHPIDAAQREAHFRDILGDKTGLFYSIDSAPVKIGQRCWIGLHSIVMKGVAVGDEAIIGAGSVVTKSIGSRVLAGGNPAVEIRQL